MTLAEDFLKSGATAYPSNAAAKTMLKIPAFSDVEIVEIPKTGVLGTLRKKTPSSRTKVGGRG